MDKSIGMENETAGIVVVTQFDVTEGAVCATMQVLHPVVAHRCCILLVLLDLTVFR